MQADAIILVIVFLFIVIAVGVNQFQKMSSYHQFNNLAKENVGNNIVYITYNEFLNIIFENEWICDSLNMSIENGSYSSHSDDYRCFANMSKSNFYISKDWKKINYGFKSDTDYEEYKAWVLDFLKSKNISSDELN